MIRTAVMLLAALIATPAGAQTKPTALLINGLFMYQPAALTPLASLGAALERQGFRVVIDTHFLLQHSDEEPVIVIGQSRGGSTALEFQKRQRQLAKYIPFTITLDAAPALPCAVPNWCVNIKTPRYRRVARAMNIPAPVPNIPLVDHVAMAFDDNVIRLVLNHARPHAESMK